MEGTDAPAPRLTRRVSRGPSLEHDTAQHLQQQAASGRKQQQGKGRGGGRGKKGGKSQNEAAVEETIPEKTIHLGDPPAATRSMIPYTAESAVGQRVMVWWYDLDDHEEGKGPGGLYTGRIDSYDAASGMHTIFYPDESRHHTSDLATDEIVLWNGDDPNAPDAVITWGGCTWLVEDQGVPAEAAGAAAAGGAEAAGGAQQGQQPTAAAAAAGAPGEGELSKQSSLELKTRRFRGRKGAGPDEETGTPKAAAAATSAAAAGRSSKRQRRGPAAGAKDLRRSLSVEEPAVGAAGELAQQQEAAADAAAATTGTRAEQQQQPVSSEGLSVEVVPAMALPGATSAPSIDQRRDEVAQQAQQAERGPAGACEVDAVAIAAAAGAAGGGAAVEEGTALAAAAGEAALGPHSQEPLSQQPASQGQEEAMEVDRAAADAAAPPPLEGQRLGAAAAAGESQRPEAVSPAAGARTSEPAPQRLGSAGKQARRVESGSEGEALAPAQPAAARAGPAAPGKDGRLKRVGKEKGPQAAAGPPAKRELAGEPKATEPSAPLATARSGGSSKVPRPAAQQAQQQRAQQAQQGGANSELQELQALQEQLSSRSQKLGQVLGEAGDLARQVKEVLQQLRDRGVTVEQLQATQQAAAQEGGSKAGLGRAVAQVAKDVRRLAPPVAEVLGDEMLGAVLSPSAREGFQQVDQVADSSKALVDDWRAMATGQAQQVEPKVQQAQQARQQGGEQDVTPRHKKPRLSSQGASVPRPPSVAQKLFAAPLSQQQGQQGQGTSPSKLPAQLGAPAEAEQQVQQEQQEQHGGSPTRAAAAAGVKEEGAEAERGLEAREEELFQSTGNKDRDQALLILASALASQRHTFRAAAELEEALFLKHPPAPQAQQQQQKQQQPGRQQGAAGVRPGGDAGGRCSVQYLKELRVLWEALSPQSPEFRPMLRYLLLSGELAPSQLVLGTPQEVQQSESQGLQRLLAKQQQQRQRPGEGGTAAGGSIGAVLDQLPPPPAGAAGPQQAELAQHAQQGGAEPGREEPQSTHTSTEGVAMHAEAAAGPAAMGQASAEGSGLPPLPPPPVLAAAVLPEVLPPHQAPAEDSGLLPPLPPPSVLVTAMLPVVAPYHQDKREVVWLGEAAGAGHGWRGLPPQQPSALPPPPLVGVLAPSGPPPHGHPTHAVAGALPNGMGAPPAPASAAARPTGPSMAVQTQQAAGAEAAGQLDAMDIS